MAGAVDVTQATRGPTMHVSVAESSPRWAKYEIPHFVGDARRAEAW